MVKSAKAPRSRKRRREESPDEQESNHDAPTGESSKSKRQRKARGRRGILEDLPNMPLDIVFEILVYLEPLDLLNLSRTSKDLRSLLLSKSSELFWKEARQNVEDLPNCPSSFLSEPAFVNLLFSHYCHKCLKPNVKNVQWCLRSRFCDTCVLEETIHPYEVVLFGVPQGEYGIAGLILTHSDTQRGTRQCLKGDVSDMQQRLLEALDSGTTIDAFRKAMWALNQEISSFADRCMEWQKKRVKARAIELKNLKMMRLQKIIERLRECGWGPELDYLAREKYTRLLAVKGINVGKLLTESAWNRLRGPAEEVMKTAREALGNIAEAEKLKPRFKLVNKILHSWRQEYDMLFPHVRQFVVIPEVRAILDSPESEPVTADRLAMLKPILPELVSQWRKDASLKFCRDLFSWEDMTDEEASSLARTWLFKCRLCLHKRSYPEVLTHCCRKRPKGDKEDNYGLTADVVFNACTLHGSNQFWDCKEATFKIIRLCGLDPETATRSEMDALNIRFAFTTKMSKFSYVEIEDWRGIAIGLDKRRSAYLMRLNEEDTARALALEAAANGKPSKPKLCAHCTKSAFKYHFQNMHNITKPTKSDYYRHPDNSPDCGPSVYFVPTKLSLNQVEPFVATALKKGRAEFRDLTKIWAWKWQKDDSGGWKAEVDDCPSGSSSDDDSDDDSGTELSGSDLSNSDDSDDSPVSPGDQDDWDDLDSSISSSDSSDSDSGSDSDQPQAN